MKKNNMVFVILHYKNMSDTVECVESIKKLDDESKIVIVDNHSGNKEDDKKLKKIADDLIITKENLGYANGNNVGIELARKKYDPDFIAVINNDTIIEQKNFIKLVNEIYKEEKFDAFGPKIITKEGDSVNPFPCYKNIDEVNAAIKKSEKLIKIYKSSILSFILKTYLNIKYSIKKIQHLKNGEERKRDVSLHGCAIIFSKKYLKKYKDAFYKGTFLYHEEEFLEYRRSRDNLIYVYDPKVEIFHKEGSSLKYKYNKKYNDSMIFREENIKKSLIELRSVMLENKKI